MDAEYRLYEHRIANMKYELRRTSPDFRATAVGKLADELYNELLAHAVLMPGIRHVPAHLHDQDHDQDHSLWRRAVIHIQIWLVSFRGLQAEVENSTKAKAPAVRKTSTPSTPYKTSSTSSSSKGARAKHVKVKIDKIQRKDVYFSSRHP